MNRRQRQSHSIESLGKKLTWDVERLWEITENFESFDYRVSSFDGFEKDCWFGDRHKPTVKKVLEHYKKIMNADYAYPIILNEEGVVMDGIHRICKALLEDRDTVKAVKFDKNPEPDKSENL